MIYTEIIKRKPQGLVNCLAVYAFHITISIHLVLNSLTKINGRPALSAAQRVAMGCLLNCPFLSLAGRLPDSSTLLGWKRRPPIGSKAHIYYM